MKEVRIVRGVFGWEIAPMPFFSRRPPIPLYTIVARAHMHAAKVCDLSIVQGPLSVAPYQTLRYDSHCPSL
jgi:hypothetical protein